MHDYRIPDLVQTYFVTKATKALTKVN